jgi:hypothetical protein
MPREKDTGLVTVATIRKGSEGDEILFNERQQIFSLSDAAKARAETSGFLKDAVKKNTPVRSCSIQNARPSTRSMYPKAEEIREFRKNLIP